MSYANFVVSWRYRKPLRSHKKTKSSYIPQMTSNLKGTLLSLTLKVEGKKMVLFFLI